MADARDTLRGRLGDEVELLGVLTDDECARLLTALTAGREHARTELDRSLESALGALPALIRRPARKTLFG
jgi:hypothetical protein